MNATISKLNLKGVEALFKIDDGSVLGELYHQDDSFEKEEFSQKEEAQVSVYLTKKQYDTIKDSLFVRTKISLSSDGERRSELQFKCDDIVAEKVSLDLAVYADRTGNFLDGETVVIEKNEVSLDWVEATILSYKIVKENEEEVVLGLNVKINEVDNVFKNEDLVKLYRENS